MKEFDDIELRTLLKEQSPEPRYDEWFKKRVTKRLPQKKPNFIWIQCIVYLIGAVVCGLVWVTFLTNLDITAITVEEIVKYITLMGVSFALLWQTLRITVLTD